MNDSHHDGVSLIRKILLVVLGALASFLPLVTGVWERPLLFSVFVYVIGAFVIFGAVAYLVGRVSGRRKKAKRELETARWGSLIKAWFTFALPLLGFGLGILAFRYLPDVEFLVARYVFLDTDKELLLAALLFLGVIMGFFVVRNWSQDQKDFITSLSAVLSGVFLATILDQVGGINTLSALANYALGFTVSGAINLIVYTRLIRDYSLTGSLSSRAVIDNLYGSDKAKAIDAYFLKNFEADPNYARRLLVEALRQYREKVLAEFARKVGDRWKSSGTVGGSTPALYRLLSIRCESEPGPDDGGGASPQEPGGGGSTSPPTPTEPDASTTPAPTPPAQGGAVGKKKRIFHVVTFKKIDFDKKKPINSEVFRMGVTVKVAESLIYILAPGEYRKPFPIYESIAGLALRARQTVVMDRDMYKSFRHEEFKDGICPHELEHRRGRGREEIDYLSYISVPVVSRIGNPEEVSLGIINVDNKLFVATQDEVAAVEVRMPSGAEGEPGEDDIITAKVELETLKDWASRLFEQEDEAVKYLEEMRAVAVPLLELYLKCLHGSSR